MKFYQQQGDLAEAASRLYNALHKLDQLKTWCNYRRKISWSWIRRTINDRLERANKKINPA
jgi:L-threonylcarbamoyladenylate synthase